MNDPGGSLQVRAAQLVAAGEAFQAIAYAALRARAGRIARGGVIRIGQFELTVAENEIGNGSVVLIILPAAQLEGLAMAAAYKLESSASRWSDPERRQWLADFWEA